MWTHLPWSNVSGSSVHPLPLCVCDCLLHSCVQAARRSLGVDLWRLPGLEGSLGATLSFLRGEWAWGKGCILLQDEEEGLEAGCGPSGSVRSPCTLPTTWAVSDKRSFAYLISDELGSAFISKGSISFLSSMQPLRYNPLPRRKLCLLLFFVSHPSCGWRKL